MAKYSYAELTVENGKLQGFEALAEKYRNKLISGDVVYIYRSTRTGKVYIGQTTKFVQRHQQHYSGREEKFNTAGFDQVMVLISVYFNGSALIDVESQLITYFMADNPNPGRQSVAYDMEVINQTGGNSVNPYVTRENVASEVVLPFWEQVLYPKGWVRTETIKALKASALVKYSPIKVLTEEQSTLIGEIIVNPLKNYVINGDAGTGKTVLLTHLVASFLNEREGARIGVIVQPNWEKTASDIFKVYGMNNNELTIATSIKLIKSVKDYDVIIVDEAHKLSRRYGKQHPSFNAVYDIPKFADCASHLEILQKMGKQVILMYDVLQAIRPANVTRDQFRDLTMGYERKFLTTQFRIQAPSRKNYTSEDYINGIKWLLYKDTGLLESEFTRFDPHFNRDVFRDQDEDAYFGYYTENPLHHLKEWVEDDRNFHPEHVNRVLAGLVEDWRQSHGKDENIKHWFEGDLALRWNSTQENWLNSKDSDAEDQVGSVFAVQGTDLNKVGVLIGKDLSVNADGKLEGNPDEFYNNNGVFTREEMEVMENREEFTLFVLNIYYVLLTRGIDGIRLGFWKSDAFRVYMEETLGIE